MEKAVQKKTILKMMPRLKVPVCHCVCLWDYISAEVVGGWKVAKSFPSDTVLNHGLQAAAAVYQIRGDDSYSLTKQ